MFATLFCVLAMHSVCLLAQETMKEVMVTSFEAPYEIILLTSPDGDTFEYFVSDETVFLNKKKKPATKEAFVKGLTTDITYTLVEKKRYIQTLKIRSNKHIGKENISGVYEFIEDDVLFVDGRKVILNPDAVIKCAAKKHCGCTKGTVYTDVSEISNGDELKIVGKVGDDAILYAEEITACPNEYTQVDEKLRAAIDNEYDPTNLSRILEVPNGIFSPASGLYQGNIKVGQLEYKLLDDIRLQGYVNMVGKSLIPDYAKAPEFQSEHHIDFRFYVIDNPIPNAFAFPTGMVFIHTGLLQLMENEAQLATVLGHEIAHVTHEHSSKRYKKFAFMDNNAGKTVTRGLKNIADRVATQKLGIKDQQSAGAQAVRGTTTAIFKQFTPGNLSNLFSKDKESQADRVGLFYMRQAGYDVREAAQFWQIMVQQTGDQSFQANLVNNFSSFFEQNKDNLNPDMLNYAVEIGTERIATSYLETIYTSHPLTTNRLRDINQLLLTTYDKEDFSKALIGQTEYEDFVGGIK